MVFKAILIINTTDSYGRVRMYVYMHLVFKEFKVNHHFFNIHFCCWYKVRLGEDNLITLLTIVVSATNSAGGT